MTGVLNAMIAAIPTNIRPTKVTINRIRLISLCGGYHSGLTTKVAPTQVGKFLSYQPKVDNL